MRIVITLTHTCTQAYNTRTQIDILICIHAHHTHHHRLHTHPHPHPHPPTHPPTQMYEHRFVSSQTHRRATPVHRLDFVHRTLAGVTGRRRQLHSARRQTTLRSGNLQKMEDIHDLKNGQRPILGMPSTRLQETGPAASAPQTRTHALDLGVCMSCASKMIRDALAVAGVNRRPFGLFPALLQEACMCARHKRHACVHDTFLYIPIQCVYMTSAPSARGRALSHLSSAWS